MECDLCMYKMEKEVTKDRKISIVTEEMYDIKNLESIGNDVLESKGKDNLEYLFESLYKSKNTCLQAYFYTRQFARILDILTENCIDDDSFSYVANFLKIFQSCTGYDVLFDSIINDVETFIIERKSKSAYDFYTIELISTERLPTEYFYKNTKNMHDLGSYGHVSFVLYLYKRGYKFDEGELLEVINTTHYCGIIILELINMSLAMDDIKYKFISVEKFLDIFDQSWIESGNRMNMKNWIEYCKQVNLNNDESKRIKKFIQKILSGNCSDYTGSQKKFILEFLQGVSYIDIKLFMNRRDLLRIIRMFKANPTSHMIFIISALRSNNDDYDAQEDEVKEFVDKVYESYNANDYSDTDNGNDTNAFDSD